MNRKGFSVNMLKYRMALSVILAVVLFLPSFAGADAISKVAYDQQNPHTIYLIEPGIWLTVWEDWKDIASTGADIYGKFINADGTSCGDEFVISKSPGNQTVPRASYRQDVNDPTSNKVVVVWQDTRPNFIYYNALSNINAAAGCSFASATERAIGYNPVRVYSPDTMSILDGSERIGTGDAVATDFSELLSHAPVLPGSVVASAGGQILVDDGLGNMKGAGSGTIDYNTGFITLSFTTAPASGVAVNVTNYQYFNITTDVTNELLGYGNSADTDFRGTLAIAPVVPGTLFVRLNGVQAGTHDDGLGRLVPTISATAEPLATGDGVSKTFTQTLSHHPVQLGTVVVKVNGISKCSDSGLQSGCTVLVDYDTGFVTALFNAAPANLASVTINYKYYAGTISYNSGVVSISFVNPPASGSMISVNYSYRAFPSAKISGDDQLLARMHPRIAYDQTADRFWVVWKETRSMLHQISELCFAETRSAIADWAFDDSDFIGYVRLEGDNLFEQNSALDVAGADIIRSSDTTTVKEVSRSLLSLSETREYESFNLVTNPDIACDDTSTQCLIVSEGVRTKQTLTCTCKDLPPTNESCDIFEPVTSELVSTPFDDGFVHIYGLSDNYMALPAVSSMKLDSVAGTAAHYPAVAFDPITKKFLAAWEDLRGGQNTKIFGQLILSGGGKYNDDFIISYQDTNNDGANDPNVLNSKQSKPFISYDGVNQRFFVVWQDGRNSILSLENLDVYGQKIDAEGSLRGNNFAVFTLPSNQYNPTIAYNDLTNQFFAVWKDARNADYSTCSPSGGRGTGTKPCGSDVFGQIFSLGQPSITLLKMNNTALTPPLLNDFENPPGSGTVSIGLFATQSFKVINSGDTTLKIDFIEEDLACNGSPSPTRDISPFSFDGLSPELFARDGDTLNLVPGDSITLTVRFTPSKAGSYNKCFIIESNGGQPQVNLSALAIEPNITVSPSWWNFGEVYIGNSVDKTFEVRNTGLAALDISSLDPPQAPFTIQSDDCSGKKIASGSTCNIVARFTPSAVGPKVTSHFSIHSNDPDHLTKNVPLSGTGLGAPSITVSPVSIDFGSVQVGRSSSHQTINISNDGTQNLVISSFSALTAPFSYVSVSSSCPLSASFTLAPAASCQVAVKFAPTTTGSTSAGVTIASNDPVPAKASVTVDLTGQGVTSPVLTAIPSPVKFPVTMLGQTSQMTITVSNSGDANLKITGFVNPVSTEFSIAENNCLKTIHPKVDGACWVGPCQCTIKVDFKPTSGGLKQSSFGIISNDPVNPTKTINMTGTGKVAPVFSVSPSSKDFGGVVVGGKRSVAITVKNTGTVGLAITTVSTPAPPFSKTDTCTGKTLAPLTESCKITVTFAPSAVVTSQSNIVINSSNAGKFTIPLSGTGLPKPVISVYPDLLAFGDQVVGTTSAAKTVTIKNNGGVGSSLIIKSVVSNDPFQIIANACLGKSLVRGASCTVNIVFNPTAFVTYSPYTLTINSNDPVTPVAKVTLTGTGIH